jgi:sulfite reductase beta subunit-like hemoprotein
MAISQMDANRSHQDVPASGIQVIWSTSAECAKLSAVVQQQFREIATQAQAQARVRELVRVHVTTCPAGCVGTHAGEVGVRIRSAADEAAENIHVDLLFNGDIGLSREIATGLSLGELRTRLVRLLRVYTVEGCGKDTFTSWSRGLSDAEIRSRLGLREQTVSATA